MTADVYTVRIGQKDHPIRKYDFVYIHKKGWAYFIKVVDQASGLLTVQLEIGGKVDIYATRIEKIHNFTRMSIDIFDDLVSDIMTYTTYRNLMLIKKIEEKLHFREIEQDGDKIKEFALKLLAGDKICEDMARDMLKL